MLRRARTLILVGMLCGCTGPQPGTPSGETTAVESTWAGTGFVYASATEVGVVRDGRIAARLPRKAGDSGVPLTRDGRFLDFGPDTSAGFRPWQQRPGPAPGPAGRVAARPGGILVPVGIGRRG